MISILALFKPVVILWATLNALDDLSLVMKLFRLGSVLIPIPLISPSVDLCDVCDDVVGDLMASGGISLVPCQAICLGIPTCISMCRNVQTISEKSTEFPCIAAGYCDPVDAGVMSPADSSTCTVGPWFSCHPKRFCRRRRRGRKGLVFRCELKPGVGRWTGMKNGARDNVAALAEGLLSQKHCGEEGAGMYCVARPKAWGLMAESLGYLLSLLVGGYNSVSAIESIGGDDDRQWLTFWFILAVLTFIEKFLARVILSNFPFYYQAKLIGLLWLLFGNGTIVFYRRIRRTFLNIGLVRTEEEAAKIELNAMRNSISFSNPLKKELQNYLEDDNDNDTVKIKNGTPKDWEADPDFDTSANINTRKLYKASKFILNRKGEGISSTRYEFAASLMSFNPRFLEINLIGCAPNPHGDLPLATPDKEPDSYVTCRLVTHKSESEHDNFDQIKPETDDEKDNGVDDDTVELTSKICRSRTCYMTSRPNWNQQFELPLYGKIDHSGFFRNISLESKSLHLDVRVDNVGRWGIAYRTFLFLTITGSISLFYAWLVGLLDEIMTLQWRVMVAVGIGVLVGFGVTFTMAVVKNIDNVVIGECEVPLGLLLDQAEHGLLLTLRSACRDFDDCASSGEWTTKNSVGGLGVIRVSLMASES